MTYGSVAVGRRVLGDDVAKGLTRQGVVPVIARVNPTRSLKRVVHDPRKVIGKGEVSKLGVPSILGALKGAGTTARAGFRAGSAQRGGAVGALAKPRMGLGASVGAAKSPTIGRIGQAGMWAGANPGKAGLLAGGLGTSAAMAGNGQRRPQPMMAPSFGGFGKRSYDPEGERRFRQGAAAAATGAAGVELGRRGVKDTREATRQTRRAAEANPMRKLPGAAAQASSKARDKQIALLPKGVVVTRRSASKLGAGVALLGASGALLRNRNEPRWD